MVRVSEHTIRNGWPTQEPLPPTPVQSPPAEIEKASASSGDRYKEAQQRVDPLGIQRSEALQASHNQELRPDINPGLLQFVRSEAMQNSNFMGMGSRREEREERFENAVNRAFENMNRQTGEFDSWLFGKEYEHFQMRVEELQERLAGKSPEEALAEIQQNPELRELYWEMTGQILPMASAGPNTSVDILGYSVTSLDAAAGAASLDAAAGADQIRETVASLSPEEAERYFQQNPGAAAVLGAVELGTIREAVENAQRNGASVPAVLDELNDTRKILSPVGKALVEMLSIAKDSDMQQLLKDSQKLLSLKQVYESVQDSPGLKEFYGGQIADAEERIRKFAGSAKGVDQLTKTLKFLDAAMKFGGAFYGVGKQMYESPGETPGAVALDGLGKAAYEGGKIMLGYAVPPAGIAMGMLFAADALTGMGLSDAIDDEIHQSSMRAYDYYSQYGVLGTWAEFFKTLYEDPLALGDALISPYPK